MNNGLYTVEEVNAMIAKGDTLLLAGDAVLLSQLHKGKWIAGTTSRFIENGTLLSSREKIFVHNLTGIAVEVKITVYGKSDIHRVYDDAFDNGFSALIIPCYSDVMTEYTANCTGYSNFAARALCGWIAVAPPFSEYERDDESFVFSGETGLRYDAHGVVMHVMLADDKYAEIHVFSPFSPAGDDVIMFEETGIQTEYALINGKRRNFREYLVEKNIDRTQDSIIGSGICLSGCNYGVKVNVAISRELESDMEKYVSFGVSVYKDIEYSLASLDSNISRENIKMESDDSVIYSITCITNYICPDRYLKYLKKMNGPFTYGEIAYYLISHATVYVTLGSIKN